MKNFIKEMLLNKFEDARDLMLNSIYDCVSKCPDKSVFLKCRPDYRISESEEYVVAQIYKRLFIKGEALLVEYKYGLGFEPYEYELVTDDLALLSANEIYEIICRIED